MVISLDRLNQVFNEIASILPKYLEQKNIFEGEFIGEYAYWDASEIETIVTWRRREFINFLVYKYKEAVCPNIDRITEYAPGIYGLFGKFEFDAKKVINYLNEKILDNLAEITYDSILSDAKIMFHPHETVSKNTKILRGHFYPERGFIPQSLGKFMSAFEKLVSMVTGNMFASAPPSGGAGLISRTISMTNILLPHTIESTNPKRAKFYINGRIDFHFHFAEDCEKVTAALRGEGPVPYLPKQKINIDKIFYSKPEGRIRRVCKR